MLIRRLFFLTLTTLSTSGCATLFGAGPEMLKVSVLEPTNGAAVTVSSLDHMTIATGNPPLEVGFERAKDYAVSVSAPRYQTYISVVNREVQPLFWVNAAVIVAGAAAGALAYQAALNQGYGLGAPLYIMFISYPAAAVGLIGLGYDAITGNMWQHDTKKVNVRLKAAPQ